MEKEELFEGLLNEANMTISQIKTLRQTLSELSNEAYEEVRDKYVVYCEPAKNYKMIREMDW